MNEALITRVKEYGHFLHGEQYYVTSIAPRLALQHSNTIPGTQLNNVHVLVNADDIMPMQEFEIDAQLVTQALDSLKSKYSRLDTPVVSLV